MSKLHPARLHALAATFPAGLLGRLLGRLRLRRGWGSIRIALLRLRSIGVLSKWLGNFHVSGESEFDLLLHPQGDGFQAFAQAMLGDGLSGFG